jgi:intraflagellar transport protein 172
MEAEGQQRQAEHHYCAAGDWKGAVNMYRATDMWEEAYRVAKQHGGVSASKQVAYLWAKYLGGESAVRLLTKFGLLEAAVDYAAENNTFDFAFELARAALRNKLPDIHLKYAMFLEDEGKFSEAESEFIKANKPKEAVLMYVHAQDWDSAQRVAEEYDPSSVADVLVGQARVAFERKDYQGCESFLLRAQRPELAVKFYKEANMWTDAIRVAREYVPNKLPHLQKEYEIYMNSSKGIKSKDDLLSPAKTWEQSGDYPRAIEAYLKITVQQNSDYSFLVNCWQKAVELAVKFVPDRAATVVGAVCERLEAIEHFEQAAELYLGVEMVKEAIDLYMKAGLWDQAKRTASQMAPQYTDYVSTQYKEHLTSRGGADAAAMLVGEDPIAGLDMLARQGQWDQCITMAQQQGSNVLNKYVAMYATHCLKSERPVDALQIFVKHGSPPSPQNFNIYKRLALDLFSFSSPPYKVWAELRDMLFTLTEAIAQTPAADTAAAQEFETYLLISHYYAIRSACHGKKSLESIAVKITISLLRYSDIIPVDKAFYEAGIAAKTGGKDNMAFVFLNRFLDLCDAIEEGSLDSMDNSDLMDTDIPFEVPLPEQLFIDEDKREEIKEWVLAVSVDQQVEQSLSLDERRTYEASLIDAQTKVRSLPCVISGFLVNCFSTMNCMAIQYIL